MGWQLLDEVLDLMLLLLHLEKKKCSIDLTIINLYVVLIHVWNFLAYINSEFSVSPILRK